MHSILLFVYTIVSVAQMHKNCSYHVSSAYVAKWRIMKKILIEWKNRSRVNGNEMIEQLETLTVKFDILSR
jgi:hypothetical protein